MLPDFLLKTIAHFAADLVVIDEVTGRETWAVLVADADRIAEGLMAAGEVSLVDAATTIAALAQHAAGDELADTPTILKHIHALTAILQMTENAVDSAAKEVLAQAKLSLRDAASSASRVDAASEVEIEPELLLEVGGRIDGLEQLLFTLTSRAQTSEDVRSVFREVHTLKGEAGIIGLTTLHEFCHQIEGPIEAARSGAFVFNPAALDTLLELTQVARLLLNGITEARTEADYIADRVAALTSAVAASKEIRPDDATTAPDATSADGDADDDDDFFAVRDTPDESANDAVDDTEVADAGATKPALSPASTPTASAEEIPVHDERLQAVRVDVRRIDKLMELVEEVTLAGTRVALNDEVQGLKEVTSELNDLARACRALQDLTAGLRMTPVRPLFQRAQRAVLDAARLIHKRVEVKLSGSDTEVDRSVIDRLNAALVHLVRNAVDHGLESSEERRTAGKPEIGLVQLSAARTESDIVIEISDDGRGLDLALIRRKAIEMGQIGEHEQLSDADIADLIFSAGLSTARSVTGISGRGVGMDVVQESIATVRGRISIHTKPGAGTTVRMHLPLALTAIEGLLIAIGENVLIFPVNVVRESFHIKPDQIHTIEGSGTVVRIRGIVVPLMFLHAHLGLPGERRKPEDGVVVLIEDGDRLCAVLVDSVLESRQVIIRQLESDIVSNPAISGAVVLGDRRVALVLEPRRLLDTVSVAAGQAFTQAGDRQVLAERNVSTVQIGSNQVGMIDFTIISPGTPEQPRRHHFAINAFKVREFVRLQALTQLPHAPLGFCGQLHLRGQSIPVVSLAMLLGFLTAGERDPAWESIIMICEFAGRTIGFLASQVNRVSYVKWSDIEPPPETAGRIAMPYLVGTILMQHLTEGRDGAAASAETADQQIAFVLDYEQVVQQVITLYGDIGSSLRGVQQRKAKNCILLVEDSSLIRREMRTALEAAGLTVLEADNGERAFEIIMELWDKAQADGTSIFAYLDLVLSDIEMPRMDGYTLTMKIKQHSKLCVLPVILHSSLTNDTIIARAREVEADGFVSKCEPDELSAQLRKYL